MRADHTVARSAHSRVAPSIDLPADLPADPPTESARPEETRHAR